MTRWLAALAGIGILGLAACGPVPVEEAERICVRDTRDTVPRSRVGLGVVSGPGGTHTAAGISFELSSDAITGRSPEQVYQACVQRRSGQLPTRPLSAYPEWRG